MLGHRYCGRLLVGSVSGRLSLAVVPVALILAGQAVGHFLACAGVLAALYGIAPALGLPLLGRLAGLRGRLLPCCLGAALVAVALGTLTVAGTARLPLAVGCAVLAGAGCPPLEGGLRSLWHAVLPDDAHVRTAYTLDPGLLPPGDRLRHRPPALAVMVAAWLFPGRGPRAGGRRHRGWLPRLRHRPAGARGGPHHGAGSSPVSCAHPRFCCRLASLVFRGATIGSLDVAATAPPRAVEGITQKGLAHAGCLDITPPGINPPAPRSATARRYQHPPAHRLSPLRHPVPARRREPAAGRRLSGSGHVHHGARG
ncbi:hypothetical protein ACIQUP_25685 [Streptomyces nigra]|uniref:hypothetical protein n=1 Tax=Streptomyces nigra TaxID=1827580 RepID=UPI0038152413